MFSLNITCNSCKVAYKNTDEIVSTNCGHVFHSSCLRRICPHGEYISNFSCPQCRVFCNSTHRLYLNYDDSHEYEKVVNDLNNLNDLNKIQLDQLKSDLKKVQLSKDRKIDDIKRLYNISEQWRAELQNKIKEQNDKIEELETCVEPFDKDNGTESLHIKRNLKLKNELSESETSNIILNQKVNMLEQRLKHVTAELEKQIADNVKHETSEARSQMPQQHYTTNTSKVKRRNKKRSNNNSDAIVSEQKENMKITQMQSNEYKTGERRVVIVDFLEYNLVYPLEDTVLLLAAKMCITITTDDILNVSIINRSRAPQIVLLVEFKTIDAKIKFLAHKNRLKFDVMTKTINLKEYICETTYAIFQYANKKLRGNCFEYIACKDNKVYAKKKIHDNQEILINSKDDVDKLYLANAPSITRDMSISAQSFIDLDLSLY